MNKELSKEEILEKNTDNYGNLMAHSAMQEYADQEKKKEAIAFGYMLRSDEYKHDQRSIAELYKTFNQQK